MVCMASSTTSNIVEKLIDGYDADVVKWAADIAKVSVFYYNNINYLFCYVRMV